MDWYLRALSSLTPEEKAQCLQLMEPCRKKKVLSLRNPSVMDATILGEWMAKCAIAQHCGIPIEQIRLDRTPQGKPFVVDGNLHFSISHSGEGVVCAVDDRPIGIDMERLRPCHPSLSRRLCTSEDLTFLNQWAEDTDKGLLTIWTAKEAYFKCIGTGITNLQSICYADLAPRCQHFEQDEYIITIVTE